MSRLGLAVMMSLAVLGCGPVDPEAPGEEWADGAEAFVPDELEQMESAACRACDNCVDYARCRQPRLPAPLTYWGQKSGRINSERAARGCVAMIYRDNGGFGHVAYVSRVDRRGSSTDVISLAESNFGSGCHNYRRGTKGQLGISGFWCP